MPRRYGFLSELQFKVLQLRIEKGLSQADVAKILERAGKMFL
jgi:transcriptional regulator